MCTSLLYIDCHLVLKSTDSNGDPFVVVISFFTGGHMRNCKWIILHGFRTRLRS